MSAYGKVAVKQVKDLCASRTFKLPSGKAMTVVHCRRDTIPDDLALHLKNSFNDIVVAGRTYPQEDPLTDDEFNNYYLGADLFLALLDQGRALEQTQNAGELYSQEDLEQKGIVRSSDVTLESISDGQDWKDVIVGMYYVKPNYPGRSSHCCNGGFCVKPEFRGLKVGLCLGRSYLIYAPQLGYKASVFNLVYVNNKASIAIWDKLGFTRAGLIPKVGRLRKENEDGEEYVDAFVYYKDFQAVTL